MGASLPTMIDSPPPVIIETLGPKDAPGLDLSDELDWASRPNPSRGRAFNAVRSVGKQVVRLGWRALFERQYGTRFKVDFDLVTERHHHAYGSPWCLGREQFDQLVRRGLRPDHRVGDLGCGALRTGIWLIDYLEAGRYFGIDAHRKSLEAGARYEIPLHGLEAKAPRLLLDADFSLDHFGVRFDWLIAFSVFIKLDAEASRRALARIAQVLAPGGRLVVNQRPPLPLDEIRDRFGLVLAHEELYPTRFVTKCTGWNELVRGSEG